MAKRKGGPSASGFREGDVIELLRAAASERYRLIISSPPYNIGKAYERTGLSLEQYIEWQTEVISLISQVLHEDGSVCWQVGNYVSSGEVLPLDSVFIPIFRRFGFKLRNRIIWRYNFGLNADRRLSGRYETLLWFTKTDKYIFNLDAIRIPQLYPGKRHAASKGVDKAGRPSGNPLGKNPSDFWEFSAETEFLHNPVWELPNVKAGHPEKTSHPCQFPIELAERCVLAFTNPRDAILDPFVGTGASVLAAIKHSRLGVGFDKESKYLSEASARMEALLRGELRFRPLGKPVRRPKPSEKVAKVPTEWIERALSGGKQDGKKAKEEKDHPFGGREAR